jgi:hypothetical protein
MKLVKEHIDEGIKHLSPKSEDELKNSLKNLSSIEKFKEACTHGFIWLFKEVMEKEEIDVNAETGVWSALIAEVFYQAHIEMAKCLIEEYNLDIHKENEGPLRWAIWNFYNKERKIELAEYLLYLGADIEKAHDYAKKERFPEQIISLESFKNML